MRTLLLSILLGSSATPSPAAIAELPVHRSGVTALRGPAWLGDRFELRLSPAAAARARGAAFDRTVRAGAPAVRLAALGVPALDRLAAATGARFEPAFPTERPPVTPGLPDFTAYWVVHLPERAPLAAALERFRALGEVASADPIAIVPVTATPNDSLWSAAWWAHQPSGRDVGALEAWAITAGDPGVVIAILDTGVIPYHPDLGGESALGSGNLFVNDDERTGVRGVDDDGNGFVDDVRGWDFVALSSDQDVRAGEDWRDEDADPNDFAGHGTAVAGLAGAITHNAIGVASAAWRSRILPVRVGWSATYFPLGVVDMLTAARGIRYATRMGAAVVNLSFATVQTSALADAVTAATAAGVTVVSAAGNNGSSHFLGDRDDVLAVAASDANDRIALFSNTGPYVDLAAPGTNLPTTTLRRTGSDSLGQRQPAYSATANGTSFAAPIAAGAAALLQAQRRAAGRPPLDPLEVILRLRETATDIAARNPGITGYGTGRLDFMRALTGRPTSRVVRLGAPTVGPAVVLPRRDGPPRVAVVTTSARLVLLDGASGDTARVVTLPGVPAAQLAAADLGAGRGVGLFVGTTNGVLAGFYANGDPRPGWPRTPADGALAGGPALGDLDGDGAVEIVCGSASGAIWAWRADGSVVPGFPRRDLAGPLAGPVALGDLDGAPGLEIVAMNAAGIARAWRGSGAPLAGWPVDAGTGPLAYAPVVGRFAHAGPTVAVLAGGSRAIAVDAAGARAFTAGFAGIVATTPAIGDVDGDGADDLVTPVMIPHRLYVTDSTGSSAEPGRWPRALSDAPTGAPVVAPLGAGGAPAILFRRGDALLALATEDGDSLASFPKPGGAGAHLAAADLDDDGATDVVAGAAADGRLFLYDAGAGTAAPAPWPEARGNAARTGGRAGAPPLAKTDDVPPGAIADLALEAVTREGVRLAWTAVGEDGAAGTPERYVVTATPTAGQDGLGPAVGYVLEAPAPGTPMAFDMKTLATSARYRFDVVAVDRSGNRGAPSNPIEAETLAGPAGRARFAIVPRQQPSRRPVVWLWNGVPGRPHEIRIHDLAGRRVRTLAAGAAASGEIEWDGRGDAGERLRPGIYFAELASGLLRARGRVVLVD